MVWNPPMTAVDGNVFTAAQFNENVRDNLLYLKTEVDGNPRALATASGMVFRSTAANTLVARGSGATTTAADVSTASTSYVTLGSSTPAVTVSTGTSVRVLLSADTYTSSANAYNTITFSVSGASTVAAADANGVARTRLAGTGSTNYETITGATVVTGLTAGSNVFTMNYKVSAGTGNFLRRTISVEPLN